MNGISGTVALVTGASSGIGRSIARRFADEGAKVTVADVDAGGGAETVSLIESAGGDAVFVETDVSDDADVARMVDTAVETFGGLDFVVNNAGIEGESAPLADQTVENWDRVVDVNLKSVFLGMKHAIPALLDGGGGAIVNVSSVAGLVGFEGTGPYVASKHGIVGLTKTAALEYAEQGIRVNAVCPGIVETPMIDRYTHGDEDAAAQLTATEPMGRMADPDEIAGTVVWLCSDDASFVTGHPMAVDGGLVAR
ncbi:MAG: glucose 1-dehydrogenase [Halobacteriota archaeon]